MTPKKKKDGKVTYSLILNLSSQTGCGYFLGACLKRYFAGRSVKTSASANTNDSGRTHTKKIRKKKERRCFSAFLGNTKNFHLLTSTGISSITHIVKFC